MFIQVLLLEFILQLRVLLKDFLKHLETVSVKVERIYQNLAPIVDIEVVNEVTVLQSSLQL